MNPDQFWQKATDFYNIHRGKYYHAILTNDELRELVTDYIGDMMTLMSDWYSSQGDDNREYKNGNSK